MKRFFLIFILGLIAAAGCFGVAVFNPGEKKQAKQADQTEVCVKDTCYKVELMVTPDERARGMMFRNNPDEYHGMLFEFGRDGIYSFWMKNTLIPLDIVWIGADDKIVYISANTLPCQKDPCASINPKTSARYVLEVNAGQMEQIGAKVGDAVLIKN